MADRTSCGLFADLFEYLVVEPDDRARAFARKLWDLSRGYDFSDYQLGCEEALKALGLMHYGLDPDCPGETTWVYGPEEKR